MEELEIKATYVWYEALTLLIANSSATSNTAGLIVAVLRPPMAARRDVWTRTTICGITVSVRVATMQHILP